ncbi:MAG: PL29 family lyase N-terminal domain-containing protein, partial [Rikenellaceae bacterium]
MKNKFTLLLVIVLTTLMSCNKKDLDNMRDRLAQIEVWQGQINSDVASLKKMVETLGAQDYVTNVTPLADGTGYTITFAKSGAIVIKNGKDGADAAIVGVKKDIDGKYYWTVGNEFIISDGKKIPTTGESPRIGENGNWWVGTTDTGIKAQGDSIFAQDGIDNSNPLYVELTLANGTKIQLLRKQLINIEPSADGGPYLIGPNGREIALTFLPGTFETGSIAGININIKGDNGSEENQYYPYRKEEKPSVALQAAPNIGDFVIK